MVSCVNRKICKNSGRCGDAEIWIMYMKCDVDGWVGMLQLQRTCLMGLMDMVMDIEWT